MGHIRRSICLILDLINERQHILIVGVVPLMHMTWLFMFGLCLVSHRAQLAAFSICFVEFN